MRGVRIDEENTRSPFDSLRSLRAGSRLRLLFRKANRRAPPFGCAQGFGLRPRLIRDDILVVGSALLKAVPFPSHVVTPTERPTLTSKSTTLGWGTRPSLGLVFEIFWIFGFEL